MAVAQICKASLCKNLLKATLYGGETLTGVASKQLLISNKIWNALTTLLCSNTVETA